jgi:hypothetical protein
MGTELKKKYGLITAICMVVGIVIGSGVFFKEQDVLNYTQGNMPLGILAWVIGGIVIVVCSYNFATLANIIENGKTWVDAGKDGATKVQIDGSLDLNEFFVNENGTDRLVSTKMNNGSFISIVNELPEEAERATFKVDMIITRVNHIDADGEKIEEDYTVLGGAIFDFRNAIKPLEFIVKNPQGMRYFEDLDMEEGPVYTKVWGKINCSTTSTTITEESAFGEASVRTFEKKVREWIVTGCSQNGYEFGEEEVLTVADIQKALGDREVMLAEQKKRSEEAKAAPATNDATPAAPKAKVGGFNF